MKKPDSPPPVMPSALRIIQRASPAGLIPLALFSATWFRMNQGSLKSYKEVLALLEIYKKPIFIVPTMVASLLVILVVFYCIYYPTMRKYEQEMNRRAERTTIDHDGTAMKDEHLVDLGVRV